MTRRAIQGMSRRSFIGPVLLVGTLLAASSSSYGHAASAKPVSGKAISAACSTFKTRVAEFGKKSLGSLKGLPLAEVERAFHTSKRSGIALQKALRALGSELPSAAHPAVLKTNRTIERFYEILKKIGPSGDPTLALAPVERVLRASESLEGVCEYDSKHS